MGECQRNQNGISQLIKKTDISEDKIHSWEILEMQYTLSIYFLELKMILNESYIMALMCTSVRSFDFFYWFFLIVLKVP